MPHPNLEPSMSSGPRPWADERPAVKYEAVIRNLSLDQAQAFYRLLVDLDPGEQFQGVEGMSWSGVIPGNRRESVMSRGDRTITIQPMEGER